MFLMFLKFFVVATCIVFWLRLGVRHMTRGYRIDGRHRHRRVYDIDEEDEE